MITASGSAGDFAPHSPLQKGAYQDFSGRPKGRSGCYVADGRER